VSIITKISSLITEEEISNFIIANGVDENSEYSDALNWLLSISEDDISVEEALVKLIKTENYSIDDLSTASKLSTQSARLNALRSLMLLPSKEVLFKVYDACIGMLKEKDLMVYEKFFKYISRKYEDPSSLILNEIVADLNEESILSESSKFVAYSKIKDKYADNYSGSGANSAASVYNTDGRNIIYLLSGKDIFSKMNILETSSWLEKSVEFIKNSCPLIKSPLLSSVSADIFASDAPIGFMMRLLNERNFFYDPDELKILFLQSIKYAGKKLSEAEKSSIISLERSSFSSDYLFYKAVLDIIGKYMYEFFEEDKTLSTKFCESSNFDISTAEKEEAFLNLFSNITNRQFIYNHFFYNFDDISAVIALELAVIPVLYDSLISNGITWKGKDGFSGVLINLMDSMGNTSKEMINYTKNIIELYEAGL
jgi:hypothetical protein